MAIIGGASNPVGGSVTGPAEAREVIGEHSYAESGTQGSSTTAFSMLKFTSGNFYLVGTLAMTGGVQFTSGGIPNGVQNAFQLSYTGSTLKTIKIDSNDENSPTNYVIPILIPPYTEVEVQGLANQNNSEDEISASIQGRIYRTRD